MVAVSRNGTSAQGEIGHHERRALWRRAVESHAENVWFIPMTERVARIGVLANNFRNAPDRAIAGFVIMTPWNLNPETFFIRSEQAE